MAFGFLNRALKRLWRRRDGATAVEFAIVAIPFFWIVFGTTEIAGVSLAQTSLDAAITETARNIRTGESQTAGLNAAQFKTAVCNYINRMMNLDCAANLHVDVRRYEDFDAVAQPNPIVGGNVDPSRLGFEMGASSEVILVRAFYEWDIMTPVFGEFMANAGAGKRIITTSTLFRNEPF